MAAFVAQIQFIILCVFSGLLGLTVLVAFGFALWRSGAWVRMREAWWTSTERGPYQRHISSLLVWLCVMPPVCVLVVRGSTKNGSGTNEPPMRMGRQVPTEAVVPEDITRGYRVSVEGEESIRPMPAGAVTNDLLRRRGGYDWAFRVVPEGWRFPYRDGCLTGVTVFVRGEVRPDIGTLYFPVPVTNGVSLLPIWGCCTNQTAFPPDKIAHGVNAGGDETLHGVGKSITEDNLLEDDRVAVETPFVGFPPDPGGFTLNIPWKWYAGMRGESRDWMTVLQVVTISADGRVTITKNGGVVSRASDGD